MKRQARPSGRDKRLAQRFARAMGFQQAGNLAEAERGFEQLLEADPGHAQAAHALALMRLRQGRRDEALALMRHGATGHGVDAGFFNNFANMLREARLDDEAVEAYQAAVAHDPGHLNAQFNLAGMLFARGDAHGALAAYEKVLEAAPGDVGVRMSLARSLLALGRADEAIDHLQRACQQAPDDPGCPAVLVQALLGAERLSDALTLARESAQRWPDDVSVAHTLIAAQLTCNDYEGAEVASRALLARHADDVDALTSLVRALIGELRLDEAVSACDAFIAANPQSPDGYASRGNALKLAGRLDEAVASFNRALELAPDFAAAWSNLGQTYVDIGDVAAAHEALERALQLEPDQPEALFNLVNTRRNGPEHRDQIERMAALSEAWHLQVDERVSLGFALGKAFDDLGDYDRAFQHYRNGNELKRLTVTFLPEQFLQWVQSFHDTFDAAFFERTRGFGVSSERPVFIVGVPRSGTTLVEQILASHPAVFGADELTVMSSLSDSLKGRLGVDSDYPPAAAALDADTAQALGSAYLDHLDSLDDTAARVTDKMPSNYFHLGLIAAILPRARIIHCRRDPMDACFSNYIQLFGDGHYYSYSLDHMAVYYREYERIMAHWREVLPLPVHEVHYESMVEEPEAQVRALLEHLDLPWDDACLQFHRTERTVRTASNWQVRQPIYKTSRQRWRRYATHLEELARAIGYQDRSAS